MAVLWRYLGWTLVAAAIVVQSMIQHGFWQARHRGRMAIEAFAGTPGSQRR